jgi:hypothetical protein
MDVRVSKVVSNNNSSGDIKHIDIKYFIVKHKVEHIKYQSNACGYANLRVTTQYFIISMRLLESLLDNERNEGPMMQTTPLRTTISISR